MGDHFRLKNTQSAIPPKAIRVLQKTKGTGDKVISCPRIPVNPQINTIKCNRYSALLLVIAVLNVHYAT